jgi:hypothetical protein
MTHWDRERWGDFVTIGLLFLTLAVASYYAVRRTWRWDKLGLALTGFFVGLTALFGLAVYVIAFGPVLWLTHLRWVIRVALAMSAVYAIVIMATDEPPQGGSA